MSMPSPLATRRLLVIAACLGACRTAAASCYSAPAQVTTPETVSTNQYLNDDCTITSTGSLTITPPRGGFTISGSVTLKVDGSLTNNNSLVNGGLLWTRAGGVLNNTASGSVPISS